MSSDTGAEYPLWAIPLLFLLLSVCCSTLAMTIAANAADWVIGMEAFTVLVSAAVLWIVVWLDDD